MDHLVATGDGEKRAADDDVRCHEPVRLTVAEYVDVREDGATFFIAPDHSNEGDVVEQHERYLVVRKPDGGGEPVRVLDPREEEA